MAAPAGDAEGLRTVAELTTALVDGIAPFVRYEPQGRVALSVFAAKPLVPHAASPIWAAAEGSARVQLESAGGAPPSTLVLRPGRLFVAEGFVSLRTRFKVEGTPGAAEYASDLLDGLFGYVKRAREAPAGTRLDDGVLVWERPVSRCELLLVLQRALGRVLAGEIGFRFVEDRIVLDVSDQEDPRWASTSGPGVFDPWPFAVWLARRHLKLLRPALRVAIEVDRPVTPAAAPPKRKAAPRKAATAAKEAAPKRPAASKKPAARSAR